MSAPTSTRTALVTGAASGIGRATADLFAARGWDVVRTDVDTSDPRTVPLDVTSAAQWQAALAPLQRLDVLVNNAGLLVAGPLAELDLQAQLRVVDVNVKGVVLGCAAALPLLRSTGGACVVNVASASALYGQPGLAVYSATKAAVCSLTESLDLEWRAAGVRVLDVLPLYVRTAMGEQAAAAGPGTQSLGVRLGPDDVARAVLETVASSATVRGVHRSVGRQTALLRALGRLSPTALTRAVVAHQALPR